MARTHPAVHARLQPVFRQKREQRMAELLATGALRAAAAASGERTSGERYGEEGSDLAVRGPHGPLAKRAHVAGEVRSTTSPVQSGAKSR
jgi:hypothetical protein